MSLRDRLKVILVVLKKEPSVQRLYVARITYWKDRHCWKNMHTNFPSLCVILSICLAGVKPTVQKNLDAMATNQEDPVLSSLSICYDGRLKMSKLTDTLKSYPIKINGIEHRAYLAKDVDDILRKKNALISWQERMLNLQARLPRRTRSG